MAAIRKVHRGSLCFRTGLQSLGGRLIKSKAPGYEAGYHGILAPGNQKGVQLSALGHKANNGDLSPNFRVEAASVPLPQIGLGPRRQAKGWLASQGPRGPGALGRGYNRSQKPPQSDSICTHSHVIR